uniref:Ubiquinol-cytochrome C reductase hinge domain-containing protein n=1 Tax=Mycena chlorophos TaxID=658473 RepID=A0ABQ0KUU9_MYCCL|nr:predicted protein [Mycena chlorophos]
MSIGDFISSFFPTVHNDGDEKPADDAPAEEAAAEEPEEEEPEDAHPAIREECTARPECAPMKHHFEHCQEKINEGKGHKGEDCVEEMCKSSSLATFEPRSLRLTRMVALQSTSCTAPKPVLHRKSSPSSSNEGHQHVSPTRRQNIVLLSSNASHRRPLLPPRSCVPTSRTYSYRTSSQGHVVPIWDIPHRSIHISTFCSVRGVHLYYSQIATTARPHPVNVLSAPGAAAHRQE